MNSSSVYLISGHQDSEDEYAKNKIGSNLDALSVRRALRRGT